MTGEMVCQCIEQRLSSHTCDKCGRPRMDVFDELAILRAINPEREAFKAGMIAALQEFGREFGVTRFTAWDVKDEAILNRLYREWK